MKIKPEDIMFWILIALIVGLAIWKLFGSPTDTASLIAFAMFVAGSEMLIWKAIFSIDKKTSVSFLKLKNDFDKRLTQTENNLDKRISKTEQSLDNRFMQLESRFDKSNLMVLNKLENIQNKLRKK